MFLIIGILAAVVLPKFNKVVETRKTTEAEEIMAAVRTEQEKRCALDQNYITNLSELTDIIPSSDTKNFVYSATSMGIEAQNKGKYGYVLKMPSYRDGRLCCEDAAACSKLNKNYPLCEDLVAFADFQSGSECAGEVVCSGESKRQCGCNNLGTQTRTCNGGTWGAWSACSVSEVCGCTGSRPIDTQACNQCGTQTRTVTCNSSTGEWIVGAWSACNKQLSECSGATCGNYSFDGRTAAEWCEARKWIIKENADSIALSSEGADLTEVWPTCCTTCPSGKYYTNGICCGEKEEGVYKNGVWECVSCDALYGTNYKWQNGECVVTFVAKDMQFDMLADQSSGTKVYADFEPNSDYCNYAYSGVEVTSACNSSFSCNECNGTQDTCDIACYDSSDYSTQAFQLTEWGEPYSAWASSSTVNVQVSVDLKQGEGMAGLIGNSNTQVGNTGVYLKDFNSDTCSSCGGKSYSRVAGMSLNYPDGGGMSANYSACIYPKPVKVTGKKCVKR